MSAAAGCEILQTDRIERERGLSNADHDQRVLARQFQDQVAAAFDLRPDLQHLAARLVRFGKAFGLQVFLGGVAFGRRTGDQAVLPSLRDSQLVPMVLLQPDDQSPHRHEIAVLCVPTDQAVGDSFQRRNRGVGRRTVGVLRALADQFLQNRQGLSELVESLLFQTSRLGLVRRRCGIRVVLGADQEQRARVQVQVVLDSFFQSGHCRMIRQQPAEEVVGFVELLLRLGVIAAPSHLGGAQHELLRLAQHQFLEQFHLDDVAPHHLVFFLALVEQPDLQPADPLGRFRQLAIRQLQRHHLQDRVIVGRIQRDQVVLLLLVEPLDGQRRLDRRFLRSRLLRRRLLGLWRRLRFGIPALCRGRLFGLWRTILGRSEMQAGEETRQGQQDPLRLRHDCSEQVSVSQRLNQFHFSTAS